MRKSGGKEKQELEQKILELSLQGRKRGREEREEREFGAGRDRELEWKKKNTTAMKINMGSQFQSVWFVRNFKTYD